jgi:hypothetical protein
MRPLTEILVIVLLGILSLGVWVNYATTYQFNTNFLEAIDKLTQLNQTYTTNIAHIGRDIAAAKEGIGSIADTMAHGVDVRAKVQTPPVNDVPLAKLAPLPPTPLPTPKTIKPSPPRRDRALETREDRLDREDANSRRARPSDHRRNRQQDD